MFKTLASNLREIIAFLVVLAILFFLLSLLGSAHVAESGGLSTIIAVLTTLVTGALYFITALGLAWFGLAFTFPEANRFIVSHYFDSWWRDLNSSWIGIISLSAVAVLALVAAICMSAAA